MGTVRRLLLALLFIVAFPTEGGAKSVCDEGDERMGPNCIHVTWGPVGWGSFKHPFSTVYRMSGKKKTVVWDGQGWVLKSTAEYLVLTVHQVDKDQQCDWQGTRYAEICEEVSD